MCMHTCAAAGLHIQSSCSWALASTPPLTLHSDQHPRPTLHSSQHRPTHHALWPTPPTSCTLGRWGWGAARPPRYGFRATYLLTTARLGRVGCLLGCGVQGWVLHSGTIPSGRAIPILLDHQAATSRLHILDLRQGHPLIARHGHKSRACC